MLRDERPALRSVNLRIDCGEHVAILGPNGSGKSTLIKTITRECYPFRPGPDSWIRILGREHWNVFDLRPLLGIVSNDLIASCTRDFRAREIVLSGFFSSVGLWPYHHVTPEMEDRAQAVMRQLEIEHLADRWVDQLSSGEARRVVIARALVHAPRALIFDEPSNSLDPRAAHELREIMRQLAKEVSMIVVTHTLADLIPEIERIILLKDGTIFADGPKRGILTAATLSRLFGVQLELLERNGYYQLW